MNNLCGRVLAVGMRACADLAERARARRDEPAAGAAVAAGGELTSWVDQMAGAPFTDHPFVAAIPAERATWDAERTRLAGASDPGAWSAAASLAGPGLPAPGRIRVVAAGPGAAGRRAAGHRGGRRAAGRRGRR